MEVAVCGTLPVSIQKKIIAFVVVAEEIRANEADRMETTEHPSKFWEFVWMFAHCEMAESWPIVSKLIPSWLDGLLHLASSLCSEHRPVEVAPMNELR